MKPFNLERALAGAPVVTRDGREVTQLKLFDIPGDTDPLWGVVNECLESWTADGRWRDEEDSLDLFMAPVVKEGWAGIYHYSDGWQVGGPIHATEKEVTDKGMRAAYVKWEVEP
jgi:hypothetical protein